MPGGVLNSELLSLSEGSELPGWDLSLDSDILPWNDVDIGITRKYVSVAYLCRSCLFTCPFPG